MTWWRYGNGRGERGARRPTSACLLPHLHPAVIADRQAQGQQRIDVLAFPMHPRPFETSLNDQLVGTFDHPRANGPALCSELRILHQRRPFAQVLHVLLDAFLLCTIRGNAVCHLQQGTGTAVFEDM